MLEPLIRKTRNFFYYKSPFGEIYTKIQDTSHHLKYSFKVQTVSSDKDKLKYYLTKQYHIIEKGLALPQPRLGFGQSKIRDVIEKTKAYEKKYGEDEMVRSIRKTISEYQTFNTDNGFKLPNDFSLILNDFLNGKVKSEHGGLKYISKDFSSSLNLSQFSDFAKSRVSVRDFSYEQVPEHLLFSVVETAKYAPSVCNRQGWKVHYYSDKELIKKILSYQNGNKGFTSSIDKLLIVTADAKAFTSYESNQIFVDGGLFSMNLLLAIHAAGLGACPLNTCYPYFLENSVKRISDIPDNERLIMMIAVGCLKENYSVAYSARKPTEETLIIH